MLAGEVSRKTGFLRTVSRGSKLRRWNGDERLFSASMWRYLTGEGYAVEANNGTAVADGHHEKKRKTSGGKEEPSKRKKLVDTHKQRSTNTYPDVGRDTPNVVQEARLGDTGLRLFGGSRVRLLAALDCMTDDERRIRLNEAT